MTVVGITGTTGYIGGLTERHFLSRGDSVIRLVRRPRPNGDDRRYELGKEVDPMLLAGLDVLIHCAFDLSAVDRRRAWEINVVGTHKLLSAAERAIINRVLFVSSMSAYRGTRQVYGRSKLACESYALTRGMAAIRPGLVWGRQAGGMFQTLGKLAGAPLVPVLGGKSARQFFCHEDDLAAAIAAIADAPTIPDSPLGAANPIPVPIAELLDNLGRAQIAGTSGSPRLVHLPWRPMYAAMRAAEVVRIRLPVRADSLLGLVRPASTVTGATWFEEAGLSFRPFPSDVASLKMTDG